MQIIFKYSQFIILLPFIIGLVNKSYNNIERKYLFSAIILGIIAEILMVAAIYLWRNNMPVVHIYTVIEFIFLASVFYNGQLKILNSKQYKLLILAFIFLSIFNTIFFQGIWMWNSNIRSLEGAILISLSLLYFFTLIKKLTIPSPARTFQFWFSIAVLFYFSGNLLIFIYSNHLTELGIQSDDSRILEEQIRVISFILNIFLYIFYSIAFLCKEQKPFPKSSLSAP